MNDRKLLGRYEIEVDGTRMSSCPIFENPPGGPEAVARRAERMRKTYPNHFTRVVKWWVYGSDFSLDPVDTVQEVFAR